MPFTWTRGRLFDFMSAFVLYELAVEGAVARVESVAGRPTSRWKVRAPQWSLSYAAVERVPSGVVC